MTIASGAIRVREPGNGSKTEFIFSFRAYATTDIKVYKVVRATDAASLQTITTNYTVALSSTGTGGTVTFLVAPTALQDSLIVLALPESQSTTLLTNGKFRDDHIEGMADRLTLLIQQVLEKINRATLYSISSAYSPGSIYRATAANMPAVPAAGDIFLAVDTAKVYVCFVASTWVLIN